MTARTMRRRLFLALPALVGARAAAAEPANAAFFERAILALEPAVGSLRRQAQGPEDFVAIASCLNFYSSRVYEALGGQDLAEREFRAMADLIAAGRE